jgi:hypothetical protein
MDYAQRAEIQRQLSVLEKEYIKKYDNTIVNCQKEVSKHSSNKNRHSTYKRSIANRGTSNPHCQNKDEKNIAEILWLKCNTQMKNSDIAKHYDYTNEYTFRIGYDRWLSLTPIKPEWLDIAIEKVDILAQAN